MKIRRSPKGFTLIELLVVISIIAVLASLAIPAGMNVMVKGNLMQAVANSRQVHMATMSMVTDGVSTSDSMLQWPGDLYDTTDADAKVNNLAEFVQRLVKYEYLKAGDLKVFTASGIMPYKGSADATSGQLSTPFNDSNSAFKLYWVRDNDPANTLFLATKNYTYNQELNATAKPFGDKGFVVIRKGGDAASYKKQQATGNNVQQIIGNVPGAGNSSTPGTESASNCYQTQQ